MVNIYKQGKCSGAKYNCSLKQKMVMVKRAKSYIVQKSHVPKNDLNNNS